MWMTSRLTTITIIQKPAQIPTVYGGNLVIVRNKLVALSPGSPPTSLSTTKMSTLGGCPTIRLNPSFTRMQYTCIWNLFTSLHSHQHHPVQAITIHCLEDDSSILLVPLLLVGVQSNLHRVLTLRMISYVTGF